jgi:hypothetical protein
MNNIFALERSPGVVMASTDENACRSRINNNSSLISVPETPAGIKSGDQKVRKPANV